MFDDDFDFDDEFEGFNPFRAQKELMTLPELTETQCFLCDQCGSGNAVKPLHYKNVYWGMVNMQTGEGTESFVMIYVSPCCKADLSIWDEDIEDYVPIDSKHYSATEEQT
ncbi:hypothetical protein [Acinetobacter sp. YH1901141]|uniref:hypothetical protein n=1 Tax=Acinetobacter sp. YH1901141 TaxID=2601201 RepID=UPI0015D2FF82|nr:hypothetical protein [Acinetobacter sp. YH1901141]